MPIEIQDEDKWRFHQLDGTEYFVSHKTHHDDGSTSSVSVSLYDCIQKIAVFLQDNCVKFRMGYITDESLLHNRLPATKWARHAEGQVTWSSGKTSGRIVNLSVPIGIIHAVPDMLPMMIPGNDRDLYRESFGLMLKDVVASLHVDKSRLVVVAPPPTMESEIDLA